MDYRGRYGSDGLTIVDSVKGRLIKQQKLVCMASKFLRNAYFDYGVGQDVFFGLMRAVQFVAL